MPSTRERVILAVAALIRAALPKASHHRNTDKPERIDTGGFVNVGDGDPGEPVVTLSPLTWIYDHVILVDVAAGETRSGSTILSAEANLDAMLQAIGAAIAADRTLGGLCDFLMVEAADPDPVTDDGADVYRAVTLAIVAVYGTTDPLN